MTEVYTAPTNGHEITKTGMGRLHVSYPGMDSVSGHEPTVLKSGRVQSLREFFRDERDKELGRWRDPKHPDLFAKQDGKGDRLYVTDERNNERYLYYRGEKYDTSEEPGAVAQAYFEAHPVKQSWHDAEQGEVWSFKSRGDDPPVSFVSLGDNVWVNPSGMKIRTGHYRDKAPYSENRDKSYEPVKIYPTN